MKKYIVGIILGLAFLATSRNANASDGLYVRDYIVTEIECGVDGVNLVTIQGSDGHLYAYYDDEVLCVGETVSCLMYGDICVDAERKANVYL